MSEDLLAALDLGSSKARCLLAVPGESGPTVVAWGEAPSEGVRQGTIINIRSAAQAVETAVSTAEEAGYEVTALTCSISGQSIDGLNSRGVVAVQRDQEIEASDIERVMEAARAVVLPEDREMLHVLSQQYVVDGVGGIADPRGMMGVRLEVEAHIVTVGLTAVRNLINAVNMARYRVEEIQFSALAASEAVLTLEERIYGCVHLHLGAGTTDVVLWLKGAPWFTRSYPLGGELVTQDLSQVLHISLLEAERIKTTSGFCHPAFSSDETVLIQQVGNTRVLEVPAGALLEIIAARMAETFNIVRGDLARGGFLGQIGGGVVLTGGGSQLLGTVELAEEIFGRHARVGVPMNIQGLRDPFSRTEWAPCCGLLLAAQKRHRMPRPQRPGRGGVKGWFQRLINRFI